MELSGIFGMLPIRKCYYCFEGDTYCTLVLTRVRPIYMHSTECWSSGISRASSCPGNAFVGFLLEIL